MATLQCKMCGGNLVLPEEGNITVCDSCGLQQTLPSVDDEKRLHLYEQANTYRRARAFDMAAATYSSIVAEFPQEAEAYWGLVLCKYGIEYVEDPKTRRPIPTCHRSSYDSVLEDDNLKKACQNADFFARKQYMEDAEKLEKIRQGIVAVSAKEDPYDVFICYKESDDRGNRTEDSVLAQNLYKALTDAGYRVFFARVTLENQLGSNYESYIFAALHSAKVMLVVATRKEHVEAEWVKNEWSRYQKLMERDSTKRLVPCFHGMDPAGFEPFFGKTQAQDLSKLGAEQDILHGIEKLIPKKASAPERVIVQGGGTNTEALLNRGRMALEDGDWRSADDFFEKVLNNDAQNAQAYLGKALAKEHAASLDQLVQWRKQGLETASSVKLSITKDPAREQQVIDSCCLENYVKKSDLEQVFRFDPEYDSFITARTEKSRNEKTFWEQHKLLKRAEQFADPELIRKLQNAKDEVLRYADELLQQAQEDVERRRKAREEKYAQHLQNATEKAQYLYNKGLDRREADYQSLVERAENAISAKDANVLMEVQRGFGAMRSYKESAAMIDSCRRALAMIDDDRRKAAEKAEQDRVRQEKADRVKAKAAAVGKKVSGCLIKIGIVLAIIIFLIVLFTTIIPNNKYNKAVEKMENGDYYGAAEDFLELDDHKDSRDQAVECIEALVEMSEFSTAEELMDRVDWQEMYEVRYSLAQKYLEADDTYKAAVNYGKASEYSDAFQRSKALWLGLTNRQYSDLGSEGYVAAVTKEGKVNVNAGWLNDAYGVSTLEESPLAQIEGVEAVALRGGEDLIMLMSDGTVKVECIHGTDCGIKSTLSEWKNVIDIAAGNDNVIALCMDGTVVTTASSGILSDCGNLVDVVAGGGDDYFGGIRADGTVWTHGTVYDVTQEIAEWTDIIDFDIGGYQVVGLKKDGTVLVSCSYESNNQSKAESWTGMVEVACGYDYVLGIRSDGEIISTNGIGMDGLGFACIEAGRQERVDYYVGVKADGTLKACGEYWNADTDLAKLSDWKNIKVEDELPDFAPEDQQNTPALPPEEG